MNNLTDEEKLRLINETQKLVEEYNILSMDLDGLRNQISKIDIFKRTMSTEYNELYKMMESRISIKSKRLLEVVEQIETNKNLLGIGIKKKKNK